MSRAGELVKLKSRIEELRSARERAKGALEQQLEIIRSKWGLDSIDEAKKKLTELRNEVEKLREQFDMDFEAFTEKWKEQLGI